VLKHFEAKPPKGEIVVVVGGKVSEARAKNKEERE
jgi:16S rRNA (cytidine1402-2'-O)-methyltransferase